MKLGRAWTLMATGLLGVSLLLSPLAYAEEGTQGSAMTEGHKGAMKEGKAKKKHVKKHATRKRSQKSQS